MRQQKFAVFDIDGTLIRWQLYHAVVDRLAKDGLLGEDTHRQLHESRMIWKRREHHDAFKSYEATVIRAYESALPKLAQSDFDRMVESVATEYKEQTYHFTRELARSLKKQGYVLLAISGSHQELIEHVCQQYGFDDCIGTKYERSGLTFTGKKFVGSLNKKLILKKLVTKHNLTYQDSYAIGDSLSDAVMLQMVEKPIAFNPDSLLFEEAKKHGWNIVIERKNVVYKLHQNDKVYELQSS